MARTRNIKPSFFTNDILAECPPLARLLFAGLWTIADRKGRLDDRPKKIKAEVLPYDECDVNELLNILHIKKFIIRYQIGENKYIQILTFSDHQNPHQKESASTIPAPDKSESCTGKEPDEPGLNPSSLTLNPSPKAPLPPPELSTGSRNDLKNSKREGLAAPPRYSVDRLLSDEAHERAKLICKSLNRDYYRVCRVYDEGINGGQRDPPDSPDIAFPAWIFAYTKNERL